MCRKSAGLTRSGCGAIWNSTTIPLPRLSPVTSGVPSASVAQVWAARSGVGSARICRLTVTSAGGGRLANGPLGGNSVTACGVVHDSAPPNDRSPRRNNTGSNSSSFPDVSSRELAKRTSVPPFSIQSIRDARAFSGMIPTSPITMTAGFCSRSCGIASLRSGLGGSTTSAKGSRARRI